MSTHEKTYWHGAGRYQKQLASIRRRRHQSKAFFHAWALYRDHFNNGSWNDYNSALYELRGLGINKSKAYLAALVRVEECLDAYREFENASARADEDEPVDEWNPWQYSDGFEKMMDVVVQWEFKNKHRSTDGAAKPLV